MSKVSLLWYFTGTEGGNLFLHLFERESSVENPIVCQSKLQGRLGLPDFELQFLCFGLILWSKT